MSDKILKKIFVINIVIFFILPFTEPLRHHSEIYRKIQLHFRALTGNGFRFMMFAPRIDENKFDCSFSIQKNGEVIKLNWRELVPFNYRAHFQILFGFQGAFFNQSDRDMEAIDKFLATVLKRYSGTEVKVDITHYQYETGLSGYQRNTNIVWSYSHVN